MVWKDIDKRVVYFAASICVIATIVLVCTDTRSWWINAYDGGCLVAAKASSVHTAGVTGQRFRLEALRDASSLHADYSNARPLPSAPLIRPDGIPYPMCKVWAVLTTINPPSKVVHQLNNMTETCMCIVADEKSPEAFNVSGDNVVYLTPEVQKSLPYAIVRLLPWNHFGRKNLGYLFAIHHGARVIYDTDDDNELLLDAGAPVSSLPHLMLSQTDRFFRRPALSHINSTMATSFNPYPAFGAPHAWPRGLPLEEIRQSATTTCNSSWGEWVGDVVEEGVVVDVGVIQSLANHDPDVDAIYRLSTLPLPFSFHAADSNEELPIALAHGSGMMSPYNAQATLHLQSAFWAMLLPITVHGRVSDIWRSYFAQRLFWETGVTLAFAVPWVTQIRNIHDYLADFEAESDLYSKASELIRYLSHDWVCPVDKGIELCLVDVYIEMYRAGIVDRVDVELVKTWVTDLGAMGYRFPGRLRVLQPQGLQLTPVESTKLRRYSFDIPNFRVEDPPPRVEHAVSRLSISRDQLTATDLWSGFTCKQSWASIYADANYTHPRGIEAANVTMDGSQIVVDIAITKGQENDDPHYIQVRCLLEEDNKHHIVNDLSMTDGQQRARTLVTFKFLQPVAFLPVFEDILMVVNFNHGEDYHLAPEFLSLYGKAFPKHILIGSDNPSPSLDPSIANQIHVFPDIRHGWAMPVAMKHAMEVYPDVKGHLLVNNDVVMRFWKWHHHDWSKIGGTKISCAHNLTLPHEESAWKEWWYSEEISRGTISNFLARFNESSKAHLWDYCGDRILFNMWSDAFYVPCRLRSRFLKLLENIDDTVWGALFEALTPMLLSMTAPVRDWAPFKMLYCWDYRDIARSECPKAFLEDQELSMAHPWKIRASNVQTPFSNLPQQKLWYHAR